MTNVRTGVRTGTEDGCNIAGGLGAAKFDTRRPRQAAKERKKRYALVRPAYGRPTLAFGGQRPTGGPQKQIEKRNMGYSGCKKSES
jgi:hypothetical protein